MGSVLIVADYQDGKLKKATLNALTFGKQAARKHDADLTILVIGKNVSHIADQLTSYGATRVLLVEDPELEHHIAQTWGHVIIEKAKESNAAIVGMSSGTMGKDIMPYVAAKLNAGMVSDILSYDGSNFTREMWAGNAVATVKVNTDIKVVTIRSTAFEEAQPVGGDSPIESSHITLPRPNTRFVAIYPSKSHRPDLTEASVIISGGRGMKSAENFTMLEEFADCMNAAIGASRAAVDAGWMSNDFQVGQTGKIVAPGLYVAVGISGAIQHLVGMQSSKTIIAINQDPHAPIFTVANYGIVGDLFQVVPLLTKKFKEALKK